MKSLTAWPAFPAALASLGSASLLIGALGFQYLGGLAPCVLCIWQRWPHLAAVLLGCVGLKVRRAWVSLAGAASAATSGGVGLFHTGVERGYWEGTTACTGGADLGGMSATEALEAILAAPVVRCDEVAWQLAGLSMASWNAILSFALAGLWLWQVKRQLSE